MSENLIEFNNISKFFGKVIALKDVTMKLKKGEIMCLLGDNGAGKSTLIKTLAGVHRPDEGEIIIEGEKTGLECIHALPQDLLTIVCHSDHEDLIPQSLHHISYSASKKELERISKMKSPNKIFVVMNKPKDVPFDSNKKSLILDHIQDPGNLGTIIRTADWFGIDQIICSPGSADIYNSKIPNT